VRVIVLLCTKCGRDVTEGQPCACESERRKAAPLSQLEAVVATAAAMGGVCETTMHEAARALRERAS
jgi:hypothetical protein